MKVKIVFVIVVGYMLISCTGETYEQVECFNDGKTIQLRKLFTNQAEYDSNENYIKYLYDSTGQLKQVSEHKNGVLDGTLINYSEGERVVSVEHYKSGILHGTKTHYDEKGNLITEALYINGENILFKVYTYQKTPTDLQYYQVFRIKNDSATKLDGGIVYKDSAPVDSLTLYFQNFQQDTLYNDEDFEVTVQMYFADVNKRTSAQLLIYQPSTYFSEIFLKKTVSYSDKKSVSYTIPSDSLKLGNNVITGNIKFTIKLPDGGFSQNEYTYFTEVYVKN